MDKYLIVILGPTGIGKTDLSITIARRFGTEIISADSRQFYREMSIGTAAPDDTQLALVRHHFVRFLSVSDYYSASLFERDVLTLLDSQFRQNRIVVMTGGSGMYIDAVCRGIDEIPDIDTAVREKYVKKYHEEGIESLRIALRVVDPVYYDKVDLKNPKRIIRALEIYESTGYPYSAFLTRRKAERDFRIIRIGLEMQRQELYERINKRVDSMIEKGLEDEVKSLREFRRYNALKSVGYSEFFDYFDGKISRDKAIELIKRNTRRYAKRQMTWWNRDNEIKWFSPGDREGIVNFIIEKTGQTAL